MCTLQLEMKMYCSLVNLHAELSFLALTYTSAKGSVCHIAQKLGKTKKSIQSTFDFESSGSEA
ncbi:hypothetical protein DPMN_141066 [Dreissena polymorpha]|uniref:Uncharacterized protein n=1 Tax=Dreissena polymorpha TaxID=45954 RepID=A0A9D4JHY5_DREPO|nr:hypothetical protein DPMN_141066 [Dreissena polymorpha]